MPNPILFVRHPALTIFYANPAAEAVLAVSRRQLVGMSLHELFAEPSELAEMIATVLRAPDDAAVLDAVRAQANALCARFVPYPDLA